MRANTLLSHEAERLKWKCSITSVLPVPVTHSLLGGPPPPKNSSASSNVTISCEHAGLRTFQTHAVLVRVFIAAMKHSNQKESWEGNFI